MEAILAYSCANINGNTHVAKTKDCIQSIYPSKACTVDQSPQIGAAERSFDHPVNSNSFNLVVGLFRSTRLPHMENSCSPT